MKVIVPVNNKGGTGKTTLSTILAHYFAKEDKRVCCIDLDPQCNFSRRFLEMYEYESEAGEKVIKPPVHPEFIQDDPDWSNTPDGRDSTANMYYFGSQVEYPTKYKNITIFPAESGLIDVERISLQKAISEVYYQIKDILADEYFQKNFDVVIIDTGPSKGPLTASAVHAATDIIIPTLMEEMGIEGLDGMLQFVERINLERNEKQRLNIAGILANKFKSNKKHGTLHEYYYDALKESPKLAPYLLDNVLHDWTAYTQMTMKAEKAIFELPQSDRAYIEAESVVQELESRFL